MYNLNGAYLTFEEDIKGSIDPRKLADMVVIDRDVMACPEENIKDTVVLTTYLGGKVVYEAYTSFFYRLLKVKKKQMEGVVSARL